MSYCLSLLSQLFSGFSFSDKMPETQMEVTNNLYEFLQQWYTLFPMYQASVIQPNNKYLVYSSQLITQSNPFYPFGESYAGKFVPSLTRHIHERNQEDDDKIKCVKMIFSKKNSKGMC